MLHEIFAWIRGCLSLAAGVLSYLYGDISGLLTALIVAICVDYATGLLKAGITKTLSSEIGFKGILKKVLIMLVVGLAHLIDRCVGSGETWRNIAIVFYICNEGLSILENAVACGIPVPAKLKEMLINMENGGDDNGSTDDV
jgi:toxin secretion/phage lysis holin